MTCERSTQRIILLGASNLTRGLSIVIETARLLCAARHHREQSLRRPLGVFAALGHGRAYGLPSRVLVRSLPSILDCGLWRAIENQPDESGPLALITDIGNDFIYGLPPEEAINDAVACIDRLQKLDARIIITQLPIASLRTVPRWRFELVRALLYPAHHLSLEGALAGAEEINDRLCDLARQRGIPAVEMDGAWYGPDPIHILRRRLAEAWARILSPWTDDPPAVRAAGSLRRWLTVRRAMPDRWWLLGRARHTRQPAARLPDGTLLSLY